MSIADRRLADLHQDLSWAATDRTQLRDLQATAHLRS